MLVDNSAPLSPPRPAWAAVAEPYGHTLRQDGAWILHDPDVTPAMSGMLFEPSWWQENAAVVGHAHGRGTVFFVRSGSAVWALRRYLRGGWMSRLSQERYLWTGLDHTRPWREWRLLATLRALHLPVPLPVAARVRRRGCAYMGDLLTACIQPSASLSRLLRERPLPAADWSRIGAMLRRFHHHGVRHDDINVGNVIRDEGGGFHLIDFDKALLTKPGAWCGRNLARFRRSLDKHRHRFPAFHFGDADWAALVEGYGIAETRPRGLGPWDQFAATSARGLAAAGWLVETAVL